MPLHADAETPVTLDRREGPYGEIVLRQRGEHHEIIANGCFLMDTSDGRSERLLVDAASETLTANGKHPSALLIGGLGVGFSLAHAAADPAGAGSRWSSASRRSSTGTARDRSPGSPARHSAIPVA